MHPNTEIVLHSHPFKLSSIFMDGDVEATVLFADKYTHKVKVEKEQFGKIRPVLPEFTKHGFKVGPSGATFYTIQIWDQIVTEPKSATEEYIGKPLGPVHKQQLL
jgi:hypothetical protein